MALTCLETEERLDRSPRGGYRLHLGVGRAPLHPGSGSKGPGHHGTLEGGRGNSVLLRDGSAAEQR